MEYSWSWLMMSVIDDAFFNWSISIIIDSLVSFTCFKETPAIKDSRGNKWHSWTSSSASSLQHETIGKKQIPKRTFRNHKQALLYKFWPEILCTLLKTANPTFLRRYWSARRPNPPTPPFPNRFRSTPNSEVIEILAATVDFREIEPRSLEEANVTGNRWADSTDGHAGIWAGSAGTDTVKLDWIYLALVQSFLELKEVPG